MSTDSPAIRSIECKPPFQLSETHAKRQEEVHQRPVAADPRSRFASAGHCVKCNISYPTHRQYELHMDEHHNIALEPPAGQQIVPLMFAVDNYIACPLCYGRVLDRELAHHLSLHNIPLAAQESESGPEKQFQCPKCSRMFAKQMFLDAHSRKEHPLEADRTGPPARSGHEDKRTSRHTDRSANRRRSPSPRRRERSRSPQRHGSYSHRRRDRSDSRSRSRRERSPSRRDRFRAASPRDRSPGRRANRSDSPGRRDRSPSRRRERSPHRQRDRSPRHRSRSPRLPDRSRAACLQCPLCVSSYNELSTLLYHLRARHAATVQYAGLRVDELLSTVRAAKQAPERRQSVLQDVEQKIADRLSGFCPAAPIRQPEESGCSRSRSHDEEAPICPLRSDYLQVGAMLGVPMGQEIDLNDHLLATEESVKKPDPQTGGYNFSNQTSALPQVPGKCDVCGIEMFDLITHRSGFHKNKVSFDIAVQDLLIPNLSII